MHCPSVNLINFIQLKEVKKYIYNLISTLCSFTFPIMPSAGLNVSVFVVLSLLLNVQITNVASVLTDKSGGCYIHYYVLYVLLFVTYIIIGCMY